MPGSAAWVGGMVTTCSGGVVGFGCAGLGGAGLVGAGGVVGLAGLGLLAAAAGGLSQS